MSSFDVIVVGTGGVGSAAVYHLARRGVRVVGLDRFPPAHARGSSHGQTRIIRQAYFEAPDYVPLLKRAYPLWEQLAHKVGRPLYRRTGLVQLGPQDGEVLPGILKSAQRHSLSIEPLSTSEAIRRWPGFSADDSLFAVYEHDAGYLAVEECVLAHLRAAVAHGAEVRAGVAVRGWRVEGRQVVVETDDERLTAERLVITAGPWAGELLLDLGLPLEVRRKPQFWFATDVPSYDVDRGCPAFLFELPAGIYYGFPKINRRGVKIAEHLLAAEPWGAGLKDPLVVDRSVLADDQRRVRGFTSAHLPALSKTRTAHSVCMYTMTRDMNFVVDRHPEHPQVSFAAGLSGHGFKFVGVLGLALAELALDGESSLPIGFLRFDRPSLQG